jgi:hypothetical protein
MVRQLFESNLLTPLYEPNDGFKIPYRLQEVRGNGGWGPNGSQSHDHPIQDLF